MELTATIKALNHLKYKSNIIIFTDSKYVIDGINNWILKWKQNSWKTANKKEVKNKELWLNLYECINYHKVDWKWVRVTVVIFLMKRLTKLHEKRQKKL